MQKKRVISQIPNEMENLQKSNEKSSLNQSEVIYQKGNLKIIKNPPTINDLGSSVRGVITLSGDLYIESQSETIHNDILRILTDVGVLDKIPSKNWTRKLPQETKFLTVQRYKNSRYIAIGESNRLIYDELDYTIRKRYYSEFLSMAKIKMPDINFIDRLVGIKKMTRNPKLGDNVMNESFL